MKRIATERFPLRILPFGIVGAVGVFSPLSGSVPSFDNGDQTQFQADGASSDIFLTAAENARFDDDEEIRGFDAAAAVLRCLSAAGCFRYLDPSHAFHTTRYVGSDAIIDRAPKQGPPATSLLV